jgi:7,8-dihydropterin-6-yl-methyl-4-(beta-D-ribofuranosyl)aminobenzene 5'-phosphate synthase
MAQTMRVICLVDNGVQRRSALWGEHGLSFLIETEGHRLLFDTGQSGTVLLHNQGLLEVDPATIGAVAISHAHYDHTGGLPTLLKQLRTGTPLYASPDLFRERFSQREGKLQEIGLPMARAELAGQVRLESSTMPLELLPGVWTTGEISERPEPQGSSDHHLMREGDSLVADAYRDDMALVLDRGDRLVLLCGCCHAGLLNTLAHVEHAFGKPIEAIAGGLHLTGASNEHLQHIGEVLTAIPTLRQVYPNHCTGETAFVTLTQILGPAVVRPCPAGTMLEF